MNNDETSGSLEHVDLLEILSSLFEKRRTGNLILEKGREVKSIYFKNGEIVFASSNQEEDRLANILLRAGILTRSQRDDLFTEIRKTGKRQGTVLMERGLLNPDSLGSAIALQVKEILYSLLLWESGSFALHLGERPRQTIPIALDTASLVRELIDRFRKGGALRR